jgi:hypothetical protein
MMFRIRILCFGSAIIFFGFGSGVSLILYSAGLFEKKIELQII